MFKQIVKKLNKNRNTAIIEDTILTLSNIESSSIFILNSDCLFKIIDYLSLEDVYAFSKTCHHLQQVAGGYFQCNYPAATIIGLDDGILVQGSYSKMNGFSAFIQNISIRGHVNGVDFGDAIKKFQFIAANCGESLKKMELINVSLHYDGIMCITKILSQIETLTMNETLLFAFHWEYFLKYCVNLHRLSVVLSTNCEHLWLLHRYPKLEHLELTTTKYGFSIDELRSFFDQNPNITSFSTTATYFSCNRIALKNAKLNELTIQIEDSYKINLKLLANILNEFYQRSIYKRLYLHILPKKEKKTDKKNEMIGFIQSLNALEMLSISNYDCKIVLPPLINLKELNVFNGSRINNLKDLATQLMNLECIQFYMATSNDILPFIQKSQKLNKIKVKKLEKGTFFNGEILQIGRLNAERKKLIDAPKVTIYIKQNIYLATKWAITRTDFNFIEMKRDDADDGHFHFWHKI